MNDRHQDRPAPIGQVLELSWSRDRRDPRPGTACRDAWRHLAIRTHQQPGAPRRAISSRRRRCPVP